MKVLESGGGEIISKYNPEEHRLYVLENKSRALEDKVMDIEEAVAKCVQDGSYIFFGFFGGRVPMAAVYEIVRQRKANIGVGRGGVYELDILVAAGCVKRVERGYGSGFEVRGLAPATRRAVEAGEIKIIEWSNAAFTWRLKAAAMGLPFLPVRVLMGTDTFKHSSANVVKCPFTGMKVCLVPACYPDVSMVHVHRCDKYGNAQIDGVTIMDVEAAKASRRLIITTEEIIDTQRIRNEPWRTNIPYYYVDAVVEVPWGSHPSNMPYMYYMDEEFIAEWLSMARTPEGATEFLDKYVYGVSDFGEYLSLVGGVKKLNYLKKVEQLRAPLKTPWAER